jgi:Trk K+ transport system NAD-binding subunit
VLVNAVLSTVAVLVSANTTVVKEAQLANAEALIVVTADGNTIVVIAVLANALWPIELS